MALSEKQMSHPRFHAMHNAANDNLLDLVEKFGFDVNDLSTFDVQAGRIIDQMIALLLRMDKEIDK